MKTGWLTCRIVILVNLFPLTYLLFSSEEEKGLWGRKGVWGSKPRQNASVFFQSVFVPVKTFCQIKVMNYGTVSGVWCNSLRSLWACSPLVSFCRLGELWFTVWGIWTVGSQVLELSKHNVGHLFFQDADGRSQGNSPSLPPPLKVGWWVTTALCVYIVGSIIIVLCPCNETISSLLLLWMTLNELYYLSQSRSRHWVSG